MNELTEKKVTPWLKQPTWKVSEQSYDILTELRYPHRVTISSQIYDILARVTISLPELDILTRVRYPLKAN
jgi:hypothetical protein